MSSTAKMFDGSLIATMSDEPARFTGTTWCFSAVPFGMSFSTSSSMSKSFSEIAGTPYCFERKFVRSCSTIAPCFTRSEPMRPPVLGLLQLLQGDEVLPHQEFAEPSGHVWFPLEFGGSERAEARPP